MSKKRILLKITGAALQDAAGNPTAHTIISIARQIKQLRNTHQFGIVIGGGNFFRGSQHGTELGIQPTAAHQVGMLATMMNGLIIRDIFKQHGLTSRILCALPCAHVGETISQHAIDTALALEEVIIFTGGTGNPFFTTDTNAVLRALQMGADEIWKATNVDGIYTADPHKQPEARFIPAVTYMQALRQNLAVMDSTAYTLAAQHNHVIRIFNIFTADALIHAAHNAQFGSTLA